MSHLERHPGPGSAIPGERDRGLQLVTFEKFEGIFSGGNRQFKAADSTKAEGKARLAAAAPR